MALGLNLYNMVLIQLVAMYKGFFFLSWNYFTFIGLSSGTYRVLSFLCTNRAIGYWISIGHRCL